MHSSTNIFTYMYPIQVVLFLVAFVLGEKSLLAQEPTQPNRGVDVAVQDDQNEPKKTEPGENQVPPSGDAAISQISLETVQAAKAEIEKNPSVDSAIKELLLPKYQQSIDSLNNAARNKSFENQYQNAITNLPDELLKLETELKSFPSAENAIAVANETMAGLDSSDVQKAVDSQQTTISGLTVEIGKTREELKRVKERRPQIGERLPRVEIEIAEAKKKLASPEMVPDLTSPGRTADRIVLESREIELRDELRMLVQEQASQSIRENLLVAKEKLLARQIQNGRAVLSALEDAKNYALKSETQKISFEIETISRSLPQGDPEVDYRLEEVKELVQTLDGAIKVLKDSSTARKDVSDRLERLNNEFEYIESQVELGGSGEVISTLLFELRNRIVKRGDHSDLTKQLPNLDDARLIDLKIHQDYRRKGEVEDQFAERTLEPTSANEAMSQLLDIRSELLEKLQTQNKTLVADLSEVERDKLSYRVKAEEVLAYISEQLFWIKSFPTISTDTVSTLPGGLAWMFQIEHWQKMWQTLVATAMSAPLRFFGAIAVLALLIIMEPRTVAEIERCGEMTRRISTDNYSLSINALLSTFFLAAPVPLLFLWLGWALSPESLASQSDNWLRGISLSSYEASWITLLLAFIVSASRPKGLGIVHFSWPEKPTLKLRKLMIGFAIVYVPLMFFTSLTLYSSVYIEGVGRVSFMLAHVWTLVLLRQFFGSWKIQPETPLPTAARELASRLRYVWFPMVFLYPIFLIGLASLGFIITAVRLSVGLLATIAIITVGEILFRMTLRWYLIKKRKLALAEAMERRRLRLEAAAEKDEQSDSQEVISVNPEDEIKLDLDSIGEQTTDLLRMVFGLGVIITISVLWSEYIPIFSALKTIPIPLTAGLTMFDLCQSLLIVVVTWIGVKNLPGLLELSVLRTMSIDSGTRYAVARICQYVLTAIGLALLFGVLNIDWSKFGWIAAALSVGLGFGLQEVVANFVCGLILLFERPVRVGDVVTLDAMTGTVTRIQMRATTITNWDRQEIVVPNKSLITGTIVNWTLTASVNRVVVTVGVAYGTDTDKAREIILEVASKHPLILEDPGPSTSFEQFADSSLTIVLRAYLPDLDNRLKTISDLHTEIDHRFSAAGIEIAFPQRDINIRTDGSLLPGLTNATNEEFVR